MKKMVFILAGSILAAHLTGCLAGNKLSVENNTVDSIYTTSKTILTCFQDKREAVINGYEAPSLCGFTLSDAQKSSTIKTTSGKPLMEEFTNSLIGSMKKMEIKATPLYVQPWQRADSIIRSFLAGQNERLALITVNEWSAEAIPSFPNMEYYMIYDLHLAVFNRSGKIIGSNTVSGITSEISNNNAVLSILQNMTAETFRKKIQALFLNDEIKQALQ